MSEPADRALDERDLMILHLIETRALTCRAIGERYGLSPGYPNSLRQRIKTDLARSEVGADVRRPENQDGAMGPLWWRRP